MIRAEAGAEESSRGCEWTKDGAGGQPEHSSLVRSHVSEA